MEHLISWVLPSFHKEVDVIVMGKKDLLILSLLVIIFLLIILLYVVLK